MNTTKLELLRQLDDLIASAKEGKTLTEAEMAAFYAGSLAAIDRIAGGNSAFAKEAAIIMSKNPRQRGSIYMQQRFLIMGTIRALRGAVENDHLRSISEIIRGEVFDDFLEMAEHLLQQGYKDSAAVLTGGVIEGQLRNLCAKHGISTTLATAPPRPKKADQLNSDLAGADAYSKLDQKNVTAWLDLRNKAAHGQYSEYTSEQVKLFLDNVRNFLVRNPA